MSYPVLQSFISQCNDLTCNMSCERQTQLSWSPVYPWRVVPWAAIFDENTLVHRCVHKSLTLWVPLVILIFHANDLVEFAVLAKEEKGAFFMTWSGDLVPRLKVLRTILTSFIIARAEVSDGDVIFKYSGWAYIGKWALSFIFPSGVTILWGEGPLYIQLNIITFLNN